MPTQPSCNETSWVYLGSAGDAEGVEDDCSGDQTDFSCLWLQFSIIPFQVGVCSNGFPAQRTLKGRQLSSLFQRALRRQQGRLLFRSEPRSTAPERGCNGTHRFSANYMLSGFLDTNRDAMIGEYCLRKGQRLSDALQILKRGRGGVYISHVTSDNIFSSDSLPPACWIFLVQA